MVSFPGVSDARDPLRVYAGPDEPDTKEAITDGNAAVSGQPVSKLKLVTSPSDILSSPTFATRPLLYSSRYGMLATALPPAAGTQTLAADEPKAGGKPTGTEPGAQEAPAGKAPPPPAAKRGAGGAKDIELDFSARLNVGVTRTNVSAPADLNSGFNRPVNAFGSGYMRLPGVTFLSPNGMALSYVRADLTVPAGPITVIGAAQTYVNPVSFRLIDNCKAQADQNGLPASSRGAGADSAVCGQPLSGDAYLGLRDPGLGLTVTAGRQLSEASRVAAKFDPLPGLDTSLLSWGGSAVSPNSSEETYWDESIRIAGQRGPYHASLTYSHGNRRGGRHANPGAATGFGAGVELKHLRADIAVTDADGVSASPLAHVPAGFPADSSLAGTSFHATAGMLGVSYDVSLGEKNGKVTVFAGGQYAKIKPLTGVLPGYETVGGYRLATVTPAGRGENVTDWIGGKWTDSGGHWSVAVADYGFRKHSASAIGDTHERSVAVIYSPNKIVSFEASYAKSTAGGSLSAPRINVAALNVTVTPGALKFHKRP
jgi:hypothetical protein